jgi:hypothetical protein
MLRVRRRLVAALFVVTCLAAGCSYSPAEPGLFGRPVTHERTARPIRPVTPEETAQLPNPDLPVVGEAIWTSVEGHDITMRIAVHAVRRVTGGTVFDWSVTPLHGPGLHPNDPVPASVDLGLTRPDEGYPSILLIDAARSRAYRPLTWKGSDFRCLCTSVIRVQQNLRIDHTSLLQVAFPALPDDLTTVDVQLATVPAFWRVPVTPRGMVPLASYPTELTRGATGTPVVASTKAFRYRPNGQHYLVMINAVYASSTFTSIAWTISAVESGPGVQGAEMPPLADAEPPSHPYNQVSAGGPELALGNGSVARVRLVTTKLAGHGALECLCTDLRIGAAALRGMGEQMSLVTNLAPIPAGTSKVDIVLPGLTTLRDVPVTRAPDSTFRSAGPAVREARLWTYRAAQPHPGWRPRDWPTPVPMPGQLRGLRATVDTIVR